MISGKGKISGALTFAVLFATMAFGCFGYLSTATIHAPIITEVYYDTYLKGDTDGEYIRIHNPTGSSINIGGWQLTDLEGIITFPEWADINAGGSLYLAYNATAFYDEMLQSADFEYGVNSDSTPNMIIDGGLKLANTGDEVILKDNEDETIDIVIYGNSMYAGVGWTGTPVKDVSEGVILERDRNETTGQYEDTNSFADWDDYRIYVVGQSHFPYESFNFNGNVTVFTSPDSSFNEIANAIDNAQESIFLNVYQFHNFYLMDHVIDAIERGVEVKIMLEGDPVIGIDDEERYIANETVAAGGEVRFMINNRSRGIHDRYAFNHAKYAIIDNETTIVMSENWKNTGVPTNNTFGNRGWGIIINNPDVTNYFSEVFFEDGKPASKDSFPFTANDSIYGNKYGSPPPDFMPDRTIPTGNHSHPFDSKIISGEFNVSPVLAPDTSLMETKSIIGLIKGAKNSVYVEQLYIYKNWGSYADQKPNPFLEAVINASRRGCEVKILLNPTYSFEVNKATIDYVRDIAALEGLNMEAKFIGINETGLNKTHNKAVIVDRSKVLISSINWNEHSPTNNREVGLIIENKDVGEFYTDVFLYDWYNGSLPPMALFDTGPGTYPSIFGTHNGTITPNQTITVSKLYTYPCTGTGGHTEYARIWNKTWNVTANWAGYQGDWHNISFSDSFILTANETYNYTIRTGSYPQIIHEHEFNATGGKITCTEFIDANEKRYDDWIPAIKLRA
ncbi:MAG: phospholipase D-like domain-containing protein [Halobacteriota archaeon]